MFSRTVTTILAALLALGSLTCCGSTDTNDPAAPPISTMPLQEGDAIVLVNGHPVNDFVDARTKIALSDGDVELTVKRADGRIERIITRSGSPNQRLQSTGDARE